MKNKSLIMAGLIAIFMATCAIPHMASDGSDALSENADFKLNCESKMIYLAGENSFKFTIKVNYPDGTTTDDIKWILEDIGDGKDVVSFKKNDGQYEIGGVVSATVYAKHVGSVKLEVYLESAKDYCASALIVVKQSAETPADEFSYFFQITEDCYLDTFTCPDGYTIEQFKTGFWITVTQEETGLSDDEFNAWTALLWFAENQNWDNAWYDGGWIDHFLGLGTYGDDEGSWHYWVQYHGVDGEWVFNDVTLGFMTAVEESYIGMIFGESTMDGSVVTPEWPGYPTA